MKRLFAVCMLFICLQGCAIPELKASRNAELEDVVFSKFSNTSIFNEIQSGRPQLFKKLPSRHNPESGFVFVLTSAGLFVDFGIRGEGGYFVKTKRHNNGRVNTRFFGENIRKHDCFISDEQAMRVITSLEAILDEVDLNIPIVVRSYTKSPILNRPIFWSQASMRQKAEQYPLDSNLSSYS